MDKEAKEEGKKHWQKEKETNGTSAQNDTKGKDTKGEKCTFDNFASIREVKFSGLHLLEGETRATHHQQLARDQKKNKILKNMPICLVMWTMHQCQSRNLKMQC